MATVQIRVYGREYQLACDDGQEEHLRRLADEVDERVRSLVFRMGNNPGEGMALLLAALTMADELAENKKEVEKIGGELRRLEDIAGEDQRRQQESRMLEIESAMASTLEEIALRIENIAAQIEVG